MQIHGILIELNELKKKQKDSARLTFLELLIKQLAMHAKTPEFSYDKHFHGLMNDYYKEQQNKKIKYNKKDHIEIEQVFKEKIKKQSNLECPYKLSLYTIESVIQDEIAKTPQREMGYKNALKQVLEVIRLIEQNEIKDKTDNNNIYFMLNYYRIRYHCEIVLPINQMYDKFLPEKDGDCHGYVLEWGRCLLLRLPPFGLRQNESLFPPINAKNADLNHLARVSENVYLLQQNQSSSKKMLQMLATISNKKGKHEEFTTSSITGECRFICGKFLATHLLETAKKYPKQVFEIGMRNAEKNNPGHALGFYIDDAGSIHFLDANSAWYKFSGKNRENNFTDWLDDYFSKTYHHKYDKYDLTTYGIKKNPQNNLQNNVQSRQNKTHLSLAGLNLINSARPVETQDESHFLNRRKAKISLEALNLASDKVIKKTPLINEVSEAHKTMEAILKHISDHKNLLYKMVIGFDSGKELEIIAKKKVEPPFFDTYLLKINNCTPLEIYEKNGVEVFKKLILFPLESKSKNDKILSCKMELYTKKQLENDIKNKRSMSRF